VSQVSLVVCNNLRLGQAQPSCAGSGSLALIESLKNRIEAQQLPLQVRTRECLGVCEQGPALRLAPGGAFFYSVCQDDLDEIVKQAMAFHAQLSLAD